MKISARTWIALFQLLGFSLMALAGLWLLWQVEFEPKRVLDAFDATDPWWFLLWMSVLPWLGFPIAAFYLYAGAAFAWPQAWALCVTALAINIALAHPLAIYALRRPLRTLLTGTRAQLPELNPDNQFRATFLIRGIPGVPFALQNYMLPLLGVRFPVYFLVSWSIQSLFAAGMCAVPVLIRAKGWLPIFFGLGMLILLVLGHRLFVGRKVASRPQGKP